MSIVTRISLHQGWTVRKTTNKSSITVNNLKHQVGSSQRAAADESKRLNRQKLQVHRPATHMLPQPSHNYSNFLQTFHSFVFFPLQASQISFPKYFLRSFKCALEWLRDAANADFWHSTQPLSLSVIFTARPPTTATAVSSCTAHCYYSIKYFIMCGRPLLSSPVVPLPRRVTF